MKKQPAESDAERKARLLRELRRDQHVRRTSYRARALQLFPHVCASCGREFTGKRLRELTVHHKDHDYHNNPNDGSNWMLLCLYCHDHEHESHASDARSSKPVTFGEAAPPVANPFDNLDQLLKKD
ncbi:MAG: HNH nuclease family protein [Kiritimatiellae bacterium]|nr:HNH nuclease family protein [Kiritimatiellia bacterium]